MGIFRDGAAVGSCGLHRRVGPGGLEIGYWIHPAVLRRGLATEAARLLTDAAFSVPGIDRVDPPRRSQPRERRHRAQPRLPAHRRETGRDPRSGWDRHRVPLANDTLGKDSRSTPARWIAR